MVRLTSINFATASLAEDTYPQQKGHFTLQDQGLSKLYYEDLNILYGTTTPPHLPHNTIR